MKCDTSAINLPMKQLKDVHVGEFFSMESPSDHPYVRINTVTNHSKFYILYLHTDEFYEPTIATLENYVYMLDATVIIKMIERESNGNNNG